MCLPDLTRRLSDPKAGLEPPSMTVETCGLVSHVDGVDIQNHLIERPRSAEEDELWPKPLYG